MNGEVTSAKTVRRIPLKLLLLASAFLSSLILFGFVAHEAVFEREDVFDGKVFFFLSNHSSKGMISFMHILTFFGSTYFLLPVYVLLVLYILYRKQIRTAVYISIIALTSTAMLFVLKSLFRRSRPDLPLLRSLHTYSFPSGHATSSFIFFGIMVYLIWNGKMEKRTKYIISGLLLILSVLVGLSRIVLRMHYATDVVAGFCLGFAWVILSFWLLQKTDVNGAGKKTGNERNP